MFVYDTQNSSSTTSTENKDFQAERIKHIFILHIFVDV
jgi:hypothetical protein